LIHYLVKYLMIGSLLAAGGAFYMKDSLPPASALREELQESRSSAK
jgi:hypothetical protein